MQTRNLAALLCTLVCTLGCCLGTASTALAETVLVDDQVQVRDSQSDKPKRGVTMTQVEAKFGAPVTKHNAVGAPPITRWDYPGFSVFFEREWVIDTVTTSG